MFRKVKFQNSPINIFPGLKKKSKTRKRGEQNTAQTSVSFFCRGFSSVYAIFLFPIVIVQPMFPHTMIPLLFSKLYAHDIEKHK